MRRSFRSNARTNADSRNRRAASFNWRRRNNEQTFLLASPDRSPGLAVKFEACQMTRRNAAAAFYGAKRRIGVCFRPLKTQDTGHKTSFVRGSP